MPLSRVMQFAVICKQRTELWTLSPELDLAPLYDAHRFIWPGFTSNESSWFTECLILWDVVEHIKNRVQVSFLHTLVTRRSFHCSDHRDYVRICRTSFGSTRCSEQTIISADYTIDTRQVFRRFAIYYLLHFQSLDILTYVSHSRLEDLGTNPSWVPDWSKNNFEEVTCNNMYPFDSSLRKNTIGHIVIKLDGNHLHTAGLVFDAVDRHSILLPTKISRSIGIASSPRSCEFNPTSSTGQ